MRGFLVAGGLCLLTAGLAQGGIVSVDAESAFANLGQVAPGVMAQRVGARISHVYGRPLETGATPQAAADLFVAGHAEVFGVAAEDLVLEPLVEGNELAQPVMPDRVNGGYKFSLYTYRQYSGGVPVHNADLKVLVRNAPGHAVVWAGSSLKQVGAYTPPPVGGAVLAAPSAVVPGMDSYIGDALVVYAGDFEQPAAPVLARRFTVERGTVADPDNYERKQYVIDALSGAILEVEDLVLHANLSGSVSGHITQNDTSSTCAPTIVVGLPYARVTMGGTTVYANEFGNYVIPNAGDTSVTVSSEVRGQWFNVANQGGSDTVLNQSVTPPGPADFVHGTSLSEFQRAEVDAYFHANKVRDFALDANPGYPTIGTQTDWPVNVNINNTCNATYNQVAINFYRSGGGCSNTAFADVVHHEYGHHLVNRAGSGQGAYGEGMGDTMGMILTGRSELGLGFDSCAAGIRSADNTLQYPCSGAIHFCGQLISGCFWETWQELTATQGAAASFAIIRDLAVNQMLLHSGSGIAPDITVAVLTLDDDDGTFANGTPHAPEIYVGFGAHNMIPNPSPIPAVLIDYPSGVPEVVSENDPTTVTVELLSGSKALDPATAALHYRYDVGPYTTIAMTPLGGDLYAGDLPPADCGGKAEYYVSVQATDGTTVTSPTDAPAEVFEARVGTLSFALDDDFEADLGWTAVNVSATNGAWERGVPVNDPSWSYDPIEDGDGSGQCWLTQNTLGNSDVDGGAVQLRSPVFDLAGASDAIVRYDYYLRLTNVGGSDALVSEISSNGLAGPWTELARHDDNNGVDPTAWRSFQIDKAGLDTLGVALTDTMVVRFTANDSDPQSIVEAGVDGFRAAEFSCGAVDCPGDIDGDGDIDLEDLLLLLGNFGAGDGGDVDGDGDTDLEDLLLVLGAFGAPCS